MDSRFRASWFGTLVCFAFCSSLTSTALAVEKPKRFNQPLPNQFRIGMEIELRAEALANLVNDFDFDLLQADMNKNKQIEEIKSITADSLKDYLIASPKALDELRDTPETHDMWIKLTQGLEPGSVLKEQPVQLALPKRQTAQPTKPSDKIISPKLIVPKTAGGVILENQKLNPRPIETEFTKFEVNSPGLIKPEGLQNQIDNLSAWKKINDRWNALDFETQKKLIRWKYLPNRTKAELAIEKSAVIKLREDLPDSIRNMYAKLNFSKDGDTLEFRHSEDVVVRNLDEFYNDANALAERAGISRRILDPAGSQQRISTFHYHISREKEIPDAVASFLNERLLLQRVEAGIMNDLTGDGSSLYTSYTSNRGLMRKIGDNRIEIRSHNEKLEDALRYYGRILSLENAEAEGLLQKEIADRLSNPEVMRRLLTSRVGQTLLLNRLKILSPQQIEHSKLLHHLETILADFSGAPEKSMLPSFISELRNRSPSISQKLSIIAKSYVDQIPQGQLGEALQRPLLVEYLGAEQASTLLRRHPQAIEHHLRYFYRELEPYISEKEKKNSVLRAALEKAGSDVASVDNRLKFRPAGGFVKEIRDLKAPLTADQVAIVKSRLDDIERRQINEKFEASLSTALVQHADDPKTASDILDIMKAKTLLPNREAVEAIQKLPANSPVAQEFRRFLIGHESMVSAELNELLNWTRGTSIDNPIELFEVQNPRWRAAGAGIARERLRAGNSVSAKIYTRVFGLVDFTQNERRQLIEEIMNDADRGDKSSAELLKRLAKSSLGEEVLSAIRGRAKGLAGPVGSGACPSQFSRLSGH